MITSHLNKDFYEKKIKANKHTTKQKLKSEGTRSMYGAETNLKKKRLWRNNKETL